MKKILSFVLTVFLLSGITAYAADQDIVGIATSDDSFSTLVAALQEAELVSALQAEGPFTVFAPTNEAFAKLLASLGITAEQLLAHPQLSEVLLYHVVSGQVLSTDLQDQMTAETLNGEKITVDLSNGVMINDSKVTAADVMATNGVIHVIDTVLVPASFKLEAEEEMPATVVDIALSSNDFSMLVSLLQKADLVGALQGEGPFTVFAPTNAAFEKLLSALGITASDLMNQPELAEVLLYHVVPGKVMSTDLTDGLMADTLNGEKLTFDLTNGVMVNMSNVTAADIAADNGVVHVIDEVLVPQGFTYQEVEEMTAIPKTGGFNLLPIALSGFGLMLGAFLIKKR